MVGLLVSQSAPRLNPRPVLVVVVVVVLPIQTIVSLMISHGQCRFRPIHITAAAAAVAMLGSPLLWHYILRLSRVCDFSHLLPLHGPHTAETTPITQSHTVCIWLIPQTPSQCISVVRIRLLVVFPPRYNIDQIPAVLLMELLNSICQQTLPPVGIHSSRISAQWWCLPLVSISGNSHNRVLYLVLPSPIHTRP